jgi:hypothetical protein
MKRGRAAHENGNTCILAYWRSKLRAERLKQ